MENFRHLLPLVGLVSALQGLLLTLVLLPAPIVHSQTLRQPSWQNPTWQTQLRGVVAQASWIGRGRVTSSRSFWNADRSAIASDYTVAVHYTLVGEAPSELTVRMMGGYLPEEKLGMVDSHTPTLASGEEVLLFLQPAAGGYQVVGHELGKYTILAGEAVNAVAQEPWALAALHDFITTELTNQGRTAQLPADWALREPAVEAASMLAPQDFVYLNLKWEVNSIKFKTNINTNQAGGNNGSVQEFRQAIEAGAATWSLVAEADFSFESDGATNTTEPTLNSKNEIMFVKRGANEIAGQGRLWYTENRIIKEADMWLNDDRNWDTTGVPANTEVDLQSVALHEFGHWLGLGHDPDNKAVMYSTLTLGTLKRDLNTNDRVGIAYIYPCGSASCQPVYTPTATATPTFTPTPTPTLSATATFASTAPPGQVATATPDGTVTATPIPSSTPFPRGTTQSGESIYLPVVQK